MKILVLSLFLSLNACASSGNGGGWVVGNPVMPADEGKAAAKQLQKKDCDCKAAAACDCKVEEKKEDKPAPKKRDAKPESVKKSQ